MLSGPECLKKIFERECSCKYTYLFLDNSMPLMSGLDLVKEIRNRDIDKEHEELMIHIVSGGISQSDRQDLMYEGVRSIIMKPVPFETMKKLLM